MKYIPMKKFIIRAVRGLISLPKEDGWSSSSRFSIYHQAALLVVITLLSLGSWIVTSAEANAYAANPGPGKVCEWYTILPGDTLGRISRYHHSSIQSLARTNHISNKNRIFVGQHLCIPTAVSRYAGNALEWSSRQQVNTLLHKAAGRYGLPANLLLAIAWQESGWNQHVIAHDGGIGTMQIMPSTAQVLNKQVRGHYNPYKLRDNIELGAIYLHSLWQGFHGDQTKVISAYNEGGWSIAHRGITNWPYVHNVEALMKRY